MKPFFKKVFLRIHHAIARARFAMKLRKYFAGTDYSFISSNCLGGRFSKILGKQYRSPTVGLFFPPAEFLRFLGDFENNLKSEMTFDANSSAQMGYPVGVINGCKVHLMHYASFAAAKRKWDERKARVDFANAFYLFTDRDGASYEQLQAFDRLPFARKIVFVHKPYPEIRSAVYVKGFEQAGQVGELYSESHYLNDALTPQKLREYTLWTKAECE